MSQAKIVVVEDEPDILEVIQHNLSREGFEVKTSKNGFEGLRIVQRELPSLVILDLMLPGLDGLEVCRRLKERDETRSIPIIMVTAKSDESDIVLGLGLGADDYVTKPFSPKELVARVHAVMRRGSSEGEQEEQERIELPQLTIDRSRFEVKVQGERVPFTTTEFRLLFYLASHSGRVFTRDHLLNRVIGEDTFVLDRNIDVHVRSVRKKLGELRTLIETVRGVGYRFQDQTE